MLHWDDELERAILREQARRRLEESHLKERLQRTQAELWELRQRVEHLAQEKRELLDRCQALALGKVFPERELGEVKRILEEAWLELVLAASPKAEELSQLIRRLEFYWQNPR
ncbi:hypothetical protein [Thermus amyloliquefaciens]|uniref:hypothetical protein n=1 Tax=Thermus amyloliquefaciens TaxID=1449080 RepID=UPI00056EC43C|nr:hypothetical protein [Thermus amyloliquefaciens]